MVPTRRDCPVGDRRAGRGRGGGVLVIDAEAPLVRVAGAVPIQKPVPTRVAEQRVLVGTLARHVVIGFDPRPDGSPRERRETARLEDERRRRAAEIQPVSEGSCRVSLQCVALALQKIGGDGSGDRAPTSCVLPEATAGIPYEGPGLAARVGVQTGSVAKCCVVAAGGPRADLQIALEVVSPTHAVWLVPRARAVGGHPPIDPVAGPPR